MMLPPGPISFVPLLKRAIWGGTNLGSRLGKPIGDHLDYAESWELVDRSGDQSTVNQGPLSGSTLADLIAKYPQELLGRYSHLKYFPLLIKYLDCQRVLSVQVHPDDKYAQQMPQPDLGKTEAWFIVDAAPNSLVYAGLKAGVGREELADAMRSGRTDEVLHSFHPQIGQCLFIPAGTVHALGNGLLVAEVQQSSDTTFRLFDWNRVDANGKSRDLHVEQALDVTNYESGPVSAQVPAEVSDGWSSLVICDKFQIRQAKFSSTEPRRCLTGGDQAPVILMVTAGAVMIEGCGWQPSLIEAGSTVLMPACSGQTYLHLGEQASVLEIQLPSSNQ